MLHHWQSSMRQFRIELTPVGWQGMGWAPSVHRPAGARSRQSWKGLGRRTQDSTLDPTRRQNYFNSSSTLRRKQPMGQTQLESCHRSCCVSVAGIRKPSALVNYSTIMLCTRIPKLSGWKQSFEAARFILQVCGPGPSPWPFILHEPQGWLCHVLLTATADVQEEKKNTQTS